MALAHARHGDAQHQVVAQLRRLGGATTRVGAHCPTGQSHRSVGEKLEIECGCALKQKDVALSMLRTLNLISDWCPSQIPQWARCFGTIPLRDHRLRDQQAMMVVWFRMVDLGVISINNQTSNNNH